MTENNHVDEQHRIRNHHPVTTHDHQREDRGTRLRTHIILFCATVVTTIAAGAILDGADIFRAPHLLYRGIPFAISLLLILGIHEMAHYLTSRRYGLNVTLPYFIPAPTPIGTMGAVIKIKSPIMDRRALLDIGVSGPLAGFAVALPVTIIGLRMSEVAAATGLEGEGLSLGSSLLFSALVRLMAPAASIDGNLILHPVAFAGWVGLWVTALNLIPIGQLDGGHIIAALFGKAHTYLSLACLFILAPLGFLWYGWFVWIILMIIIGWRHALPPNMHYRLTTRQRLRGLLCIVVFVATFIPQPFSLV